jgi:SAM-dependent MidA family methyltransferase
MKKYLLSLIILIIGSSFITISFAQIISAIQSGKSEEVAKFFDTTVEITLPSKSSSYSKSQAALVLNEFFDANPVKNFQIIHKSENEGSQYCIGNLTTTKGVFRTTIYIKQKGDKQLVQELRFEK